jgi:hypothetical protein
MCETPAHSVVAQSLLRDPKALPSQHQLLNDLTCNISLGNISIQDNEVICNGATAAQHADILRISGSATNNSILIRNSNLIIELHDFSLRSECPVSSVASTI